MTLEIPQFYDALNIPSIRIRENDFGLTWRGDEFISTAMTSMPSLWGMKGSRSAPDEAFASVAFRFLVRLTQCRARLVVASSALAVNIGQPLDDNSICSPRDHRREVALEHAYPVSQKLFLAETPYRSPPVKWRSLP